MAPLSVHTHASSVKGLSSVTTLVVGIKSALVFDPPFLIQDSRELVAWIERHTTLPVKAIFITHHHPDHYFAANAVLEAFPAAKFYAAPYVCAAIDREYEEKVEYFSKHFGAEHVYAKPQKPTPFLHSLIYLEGNPESPIFLLGPLQGDCVDHTLFWMPMEKTLVCGDTVYARSTHVWVEEVETAALLEAWQKTLDVIETLSPDRLIAGHLEEGWEFDAAADLAHTRAYLKLFGEQVVYSEQQLTVDELYKVFETSFPQATANLDFFLGHMSNQFGKGGQIWEENRHHNAAARGKEELLTYFIC